MSKKKFNELSKDDSGYSLIMEVKIIAETTKAICFEIQKNDTWIPKSQIETVTINNEHFYFVRNWLYRKISESLSTVEKNIQP